MWLNLLACITSHEDSRISIQAFGAALGTAALEVGHLFDAGAKLGLPLVGVGAATILVVEQQLINRVCAVGQGSLARLRLRIMMSHNVGKGNKKVVRQNSPPCSAVAVIVVVVGRLAAAARCTRCFRGGRRRRGGGGDL